MNVSVALLILDAEASVVVVAAELGRAWLEMLATQSLVHAAAIHLILVELGRALHMLWLLKEVSIAFSSGQVKRMFILHETIVNIWEGLGASVGCVHCSKLDVGVLAAVVWVLKLRLLGLILHVALLSVLLLLHVVG